MLTLNLQKELSQNNLNITIEEWRILFYLWQEDGINQQEVADIVKKEKSTVTRQLTSLEKKEFIYRTTKGNDKRNKFVFLTEKGNSLKSKTLQISEKVINKAQQNISEEELTILKSVLHQMILNLTD